MTHTPGPWYVEGESDNVGEAEVIVSGIPNGGGRIVAWTANSYEADTDNETTTDEDRANTRLIAASPDTLAALKALVESIENLNFGAFDDDGATYDQIPWAQAEAAIDKATGQKETA